MRRRLGPRFGAEAGLIAASAVLAALLELGWAGIAATVFGTWLAIAGFELVWARRRPAPAASGPAASPATEAGRNGHAPQTEAAAVLSEAPPALPRDGRQASPARGADEPIAAAHAPRSWNLWELERAARELAGADAAADAERQYLLLYLREFANPDGKLPIDFDPLVREAFGNGAAVPS